MNSAQTIFTLFYAIYFAVTTTLTGKFQPFDTPSMYKLKFTAWLRFVISFALLNIAPLAYFVLVFQWLENINNFDIDFWQMLILLILSLAGFGFYRVFFGIMILKVRNKYVFYGTNLPKTVLEDLEQRDSSHGDWLAHVIPGIIWVGLSLVLGYWWIFYQTQGSG